MWPAQLTQRSLTRFPSVSTIQRSTELSGTLGCSRPATERLAMKMARNPATDGFILTLVSRTKTRTTEARYRDSSVSSGPISRCSLKKVRIFEDKQEISGLKDCQQRIQDFQQSKIWFWSKVIVGNSRQLLCGRDSLYFKKDISALPTTACHVEKGSFHGKFL